MTWLALSLLSSALAVEANLPKPWKAIQTPGVYRSWTRTDRPGHVITIVRNRAPQAINYRGTSKTQIASGIIGMRKATLELFGFKGWNIQTFDYQIRGQYERVSMEGSYRRPDGGEVQFKERQFTKGQDYYQVSYILEADVAPTFGADAEKLLEMLAPQGGQ